MSVRGKQREQTRCDKSHATVQYPTDQIQVRRIERIGTQPIAKRLPSPNVSDATTTHVAATIPTKKTSPLGSRLRGVFRLFNSKTTTPPKETIGSNVTRSFDTIRRIARTQIDHRYMMIVTPTKVRRTPVPGPCMACILQLNQELQLCRDPGARTETERMMRKISPQPHQRQVESFDYQRQVGKAKSNKVVPLSPLHKTPSNVSASTTASLDTSITHSTHSSTLTQDSLHLTNTTDSDSDESDTDLDTTPTSQSLMTCLEQNVVKNQDVFDSPPIKELSVLDIPPLSTISEYRRQSLVWQACLSSFQERRNSVATLPTRTENVPMHFSSSFDMRRASLALSRNVASLILKKKRTCASLNMYRRSSIATVSVA